MRWKEAKLGRIAGAARPCVCLSVSHGLLIREYKTRSLWAKLTWRGPTISATSVQRAM